MALPQAPLGSMPSISLGGYIPAARNDPSVLEQALAAFLGGAAGTAGNRLVDKALPDPQRVAAEKLARDKLEADKTYQAGQLALGREGNRLTQHNIDTTASGRASDRTSAEERAKADREAAEVENWRRSQALNARYLGDNATEQARIQAEAAAREEALKLRAAAEDRQDRFNREQLAAGDPVRAAQARHYNASAGALEDQTRAMSPAGRSAAAGQALGLGPQEPGMVPTQTGQPQPDSGNKLALVDGINRFSANAEDKIGTFMAEELPKYMMFGVPGSPVQGYGTRALSAADDKLSALVKYINDKFIQDSQATP